MGKNIIQIRQIRLGEGMPKICIPLTAASRTGLLEELETVKKAKPDLVEWRADFYEELRNPKAVEEMIRLLKNSLGEIPLLFTIRTREEGGQAELTEAEYCEINENAVLSHPDLMDVEVLGDFEHRKPLVSFLREKGTVVIASSHDFSKTDASEVLLDRYKRLDRSGADILKLAVMPQSFEEVLCLFQASLKMQQQTEKPLIFMSMGRLGMITRLAGEAAGSVLTFGTADSASAPGQLPATELRRILQILHG